MRCTFFSLSLSASLALVTGCAAEARRDADVPAAESQGDVPVTVEAAQSAVGRVGSHGMVVAGDPSKAVLSHIPVFGPPHDVQVLVHGAMTVEPGRTLPATFSDRPYTFLPERTSLDALRTGVTRELRGTLYLGNFEQGGRPVATGVRFAIERVLHQHLLVATPAQVPPPGGAADAAAPTSELTYLVFGSRDRAFAVHYIAAAPSFDEVLVVALDGGAPTDAELAAGVMARATGTQDGMAARLGLRTTPLALTFGAAPRTFAVRPLGTLSCLAGPDFFQPCD